MYQKMLVAGLVALGLAGCASNKILPVDEEWRAGKPWPSHWGVAHADGVSGWNVVLPFFVNKENYNKDEIAKTRLKDIPVTQEDNAVVEICRFKKGVFQFATICIPAIVAAELRGTLHQDDVVVAFMEAREVAIGSNVPLPPDQRMATRVFSKVSESGR